MAERTIGVVLTGDESGLLRSLSAATAASTQFGAKTEVALGRAAAASLRMGSAFADESRVMSSAAAAGQAVTSAGDRLVQSLERQARAVGKTRSELLELQAAELGVSDRAAPFIARLREQESALAKSGTAFNKYGISAAQSAAAMRGVPAQITDIVVSLQAGQAPLTVLLQQGGQLKDMFGGLVPAARALGGALVSLINPYTVLAAAAAAVGYALYQASEQTERYNRSIRLSGNYAGTTTAQLREMVAAVAGEGGLGKARDAVNALVSTGQLSAQTIEHLSATMVEWQRQSGESMEEISKDFAKMPEGVTKWAEEHNRSLNFMTLAQWDYIRTLEETGDREAAIRETSKVLHDYLGDEAPKKVGRLERAWRGLKSAISSVGAAIDSIAEDDTEADLLAAAERDLRAREENIRVARERGATPTDKSLAGLEEARARVQSMRDALALVDSVAQVRGINAQANAQAIAAAKRLDALDLETDKTRQLNKALQENARWEAQIRAVDPADDRITAAAVRDREAATRKRFEDRGQTSAGQNALSGQLAALQQQAKLREEALKAENATLAQLRAIGFLSEVELIQKRAEAQRAALQDELAIARQQEALAAGKKQLAERERFAGRVKELEAQIARTHQEEAAAIAKYQEKIQGAVRAAQLDVQNYAETRNLQAQRQLNALTLGGNDRALVDAMNQVQDRFRRIRDSFTDKVLREGGGAALNSAQYQQGLADIERGSREALELERGYMDERIAIQGNWVNGARLAMADWLDNSRNVMGQTQRIFSDTFAGLTGAIAGFARTGKFEIDDLLASVGDSLLRMSLQMAETPIFNAVVSGISGLFGGGWSDAQASNLMNNNVVPSAKGNVFASPSLSKFSNQVHDKPQFFAFADGVGVFAEAGEEAIMPLQRGPDGKLGVRASGAGARQGGYDGGQAPNVTVNMINQTGQPITARQGGIRLDAVKGMIVDVFLADNKTNGPMTRSMKSVLA